MPRLGSRVQIPFPAPKLRVLLKRGRFESASRSLRPRSRPPCLQRRRSQVVRQGSAKPSFVGSIPTVASKQLPARILSPEPRAWLFHVAPGEPGDSLRSLERASGEAALIAFWGLEEGLESRVIADRVEVAVVVEPGRVTKACFHRLLQHVDGLVGLAGEGIHACDVV